MLVLSVDLDMQRRTHKAARSHALKLSDVYSSSFQLFSLQSEAARTGVSCTV